VAAIAAAHGGHVEVSTAAGAGSTFVLVLPVGLGDDPAEPVEDQQMDLLQLFHSHEEESEPSTRPTRTPS
jgi:GMP synthase-like glutamine amidotransferase